MSTSSTVTSSSLDDDILTLLRATCAQTESTSSCRAALALADIVRQHYKRQLDAALKESFAADHDARQAAIAESEAIIESKRMQAIGEDTDTSKTKEYAARCHASDLTSVAHVFALRTRVIGDCLTQADELVRQTQLLLPKQEFTGPHPAFDAKQAINVACASLDLNMTFAERRDACEKVHVSVQTDEDNAIIHNILSTPCTRYR
jgi:hypothetical protein